MAERKLNPEIFKNPSTLLYSQKGKGSTVTLILFLVLVVAGIACLYFGITPERRHYRYGVYIMLPDPNWFLFGAGIVVLFIALFVLIHYVNTRFCALKIYPFEISGYGVLLSLIHIVLPMKTSIASVESATIHGSALQVKCNQRSYNFYLPDNQQALELIEALKEYQQENPQISGEAA